jgi:protoheme IX farnesyltransferase
MPATIPAPAVRTPARARVTRKAKAYLALAKPRIIELLLVTTVPATILAAHGWPGSWLLLSVLIGGSLSAASANAFNCVIDLDIDSIMKRTRNRPLVTGALITREALVYAWLLAVVSTAWFWFVVGSPLAAELSVGAILAYVVGYTMILKRRTSQNIVWGGAAGCMPVLIGWASVTHGLAWTPVLLFLIVFFWTPPHYWPLAMKFRGDYADAHVPMLPVVASPKRVATEMLVYAFAMVAVTLALVPVAHMTWVYLVAAAAAGAWFLGGCFGLYWRIARGESRLREMRLFRDSITYLTIVSLAIVVDPFLSDALTVWRT